MVFREIRLETKRLAPLYDFYKNVLELHTDPGDAQFTIHARDTGLVFEQANHGLADPFYHFAFNIPSNKINEAHDWLKKRTELLWIDDYKSYVADFVNWNAKSVYFLDPAGNIAEFIARSGLEDIVDEPFSSIHVRNVSEIGLVFPAPNFKRSIEKMMEDHQLTYFTKQPPLESFCAIGDDEGLFIAVPEHRSWYPCKDKPAGIFPMQITLSVQNALRTIDFNK
jgi:hypothetical protein